MSSRHALHVFALNAWAPPHPHTLFPPTPTHTHMHVHTRTPTPTRAPPACAPCWPLQVPYLEDPNQGVYLFESSAIVKYLNDTYAA